MCSTFDNVPATLAGPLGMVLHVVTSNGGSKRGVGRLAICPSFAPCGLSSWENEKCMACSVTGSRSPRIERVTAEMIQRR
jgi:hypothetical protein